MIGVSNRDFTAREYIVINKMVEGLTSKQIADKLNISYFTVKQHVHNIYWKKDLKNKAEFFKWYYQESGLAK